MSVVSEAVEAAAVLELQRKLPTLQGELEGMEEALISRVFKAVEERKLSPEQALYAWLELMSYRQLSRRLNAKVKVGQVVVGRVAKQAQEA